MVLFFSGGGRYTRCSLVTGFQSCALPIWVEVGHFSFGAPVTLDLREDVDVVLMRQDPPFDLAYITATHLLERVQDRTLVVNDPAAVRNAPEKLFVLDFQQFMTPTLVTRRLEDARAFHAEHGEVVRSEEHTSDLQSLM